MKQATKYCTYCQKQLERKRFNGRLEDFSTFLRRKYCDKICWVKSLIKEETTKSALLKRATKYRGKTCERCGTKKGLGIHHKDKDIRNNSKKNLMTLCTACHTKWHWEYGKVNPKRSRPTCSICEKICRTHAGMCLAHYQRQKKYGDPHLTQKLINGSWQLVKDLSIGRDHNRSAV